MLDATALQARINEAPAVLVYLSTADCSVCTALLPKVRELIEIRFPNLELLHVLLDEVPELGDRFLVTAVPTVLAFFAGREHVRKVRVFGIEELAEALDRPYSLFFD